MVERSGIFCSDIIKATMINDNDNYIDDDNDDKNG